MVDVVDARTRSRMMAAIGSADTKPELRVRRYLHAQGFRYRLHVSGLPGRPDLVLPRFRTVIFVHGCFWHRHPGCTYATKPATRPEFWRAKFEANVARDRKVSEQLLAMEWIPLVIWECETREVRCLNALAEAIREPVT